MRTVHQKLHLQHHRHTGRLLHHKHTSYRSLAIVLAVAAVSIIGLNTMARATADSFVVYASLPAPIPTDAAVITNPADGSATTKGRQEVSGTCPVIMPRVVIVILDNGAQVASVACDSDNTFLVPIILAAGRNTLIAQSYTITGDTGPASDPVIEFYSVSTQTITVVTSGTQVSLPSALIVTIDEPFIVFGPAKDAIWLGSIIGGTPPYHVHMDWGDGTSNDYAVNTPGQQQFAHHYRVMYPHAVTLHVTDALGRGVIQQYAAVTPYTPPATGLFTTPVSPWGGPRLFSLYGAYLLLLAVFGALWVRAHPFAYAKVPVRHKRKATRR